MRRIVCTVAILLICVASIHSQVVNPDNGHTYQYVSTTASWQASESLAENMGGHLVTITSAEEQLFVQGLIPNNQPIWLGGTDETTEGIWQWITGEPWSYTNWFPGEPNNVGDQDYLYLNPDFGYQWVDGFADQFYFACIVEIDSFIVQPGDTCLGVYQNSANGHYYGYLNRAATWYQATHIADSLGGYLVTITSSQENTFVAGLIRTDDPIWLGATDSVVEGTWQWINGEPWSYTNWYSGEPNDAGGQDYAFLNPGLGFKWADCAPTAFAFAYVIEFESLNEKLCLESVIDPGHTYLYVPSTLSWQESESLAESMGGHLVTITSAEEQSLVETLIPNTTPIWMGATDVAEENIWRWITGETWSYTNWYPGEPNNSGNQDYAYLNPGLNFQWVDGFADEFFFPCIVEIDSFTVQPGDTCVNVTQNPDNGHYYGYLTDEVDWYRASHIADSLGGYLTTITSADEQTFVAGLIPNQNPVWLGATDSVVEGNWQWISGETWSYTNWYSGEPNNAGNQDYAFLNPGLGGKWVDASPTQHRLAFVVEFDTVSDLTCANKPPVAAILISPPGEENWPVTTLLPTFTWTSSVDPDANYPLHYRCEIVSDPWSNYEFVYDSLTDTSYTMPDSLQLGRQYWWRVVVTDAGGAYAISEVNTFWTWHPGDIDHSHNVDVSDLSMLVDHLFVTFQPIQLPEIADLTGDCNVDIIDLTRLVDHLFITFTPLVPGCK